VISRSKDYLFSIIRQHYFGVNSYNRYAIVVVFEELYPEVSENIKNKVCPFCGRRFAKKLSLYMHLWGRKNSYNKKNNSCKIKFRNVLEHVLEVYYDIVKIARYENGRSGKKGRLYKLRDLKGIVHYFPDLREFSAFYIKTYVKVRVI